MAEQQGPGRGRRRDPEQKEYAIAFRELSSYWSPAAILGQGPNIDPINSVILHILNSMACARRVVLDYKLKRKPNAAESVDNQQKLNHWPAEVLQLQGNVEGLGGRYLRIPPVLLTPVELTTV